MRFFIPPVEVEEDEGFSAEKDIFQRAEFGYGLANIASVSDDPLVVVLDAPWGTGKTTFIKMWAGHLRKNGFPVIYFDSFANDHADNAFLAIAAEVLRLSRLLKKTDTKAHKLFLKKAARAGSVLLRMGAKVGVKAATLGAIDAADLNALKSVADDVAKDASTAADRYVENLLRLQSQEHESIAAVRDSLATLAEEFSQSKACGEENHQNRPLIFIIDELDRCRPDFALELLERIKHVFSTPKVHFFLVTHLAQLEGSVRFTYGEAVDARLYLQKFYNLVVHLPVYGAHRTDKNTSKYLAYAAQVLGLTRDDVSLLENVAEARDFSFRTLERIMTLIAIAKAFTPKNYLWIDPIIIGLCVIKVLDPSLFRQAQTGKLQLSDVELALGFSDWLPVGAGDWHREWWVFCLAKHKEDYPNLNWAGYERTFFRYSIRDRADLVPVMAQHLGRLTLAK